MKKKTYTTYEVEWDFQDSPWGRRPQYMRSFNTQEEAEAFAATTTDGKAVRVDWTEC